MSPSETNLQNLSGSTPETDSLSNLDHQPVKKPQKTKKPLSKKTKVLLFILGWLLILGLATLIAFLLKPTARVIHTNAIIDAYKFSDLGTEVIETVNDLNYYGSYTPNPIDFIPYETPDYSGIYLISGLKNKSVEEKINHQIIETANSLHTISPERHTVGFNVTANYFNLLSFTIDQYNYDTQGLVNKYYTFDLNTGEKLSFDNLFPKNLNLTPILYKSFYDGLSTKLQFLRLNAERRLAMESYYPNPATCVAQYCPLPSETYDSIRALIAEYDNQLADIEQTVLNTIKTYLAGEKIFYLNSYGPAFVLSDGTVINMELKDNIRYAIYLKNYRSNNSIYENAAPNNSHLFFTEVSDPYHTFYNLETNSYLFDLVESYCPTSIPNSIRQTVQEYLLNKGLNLPGTAGKFRHILAESSLYESDDLGTYGSYATICTYETDKSYYDSTYRTAIIDGKTQNIWMSAQQPARDGHYDMNQVTLLTDNNSVNNCNKQLHFVITKSGTILDNPDDILVNPSNSSTSWKDYLKSVAYYNVCYNTYQKHCYTDEEKATHEFIYTFNGSSIELSLKDNSESGSSHFYNINFDYIPREYINPELLPDSN